MSLDIATQMRLTGLATGLDTDQLIQNLGRVHTLRIDAVKRDKQMVLWRQEAYRSSISLISNFLKSSFNTASPTNNFMSATSFAKFNYNLSIGGMATEQAKADAARILSVKANGDIKNYNQTVEAVAQLATKDKWTSEALDLNGITSKGFDIENLLSVNSVTGETYTSSVSFNLSIDGVTRTITVPGSEAGAAKYSPLTTSGASLYSSVNLDHYVEISGVKTNIREYAENVLDIDMSTFGDGTLWTHLNQNEQDTIMAALNEAGIDMQRYESDDGVTFTEVAYDVTRGYALDGTKAIDDLHFYDGDMVSLRDLLEADSGLFADRLGIDDIENLTPGDWTAISNYFNRLGTTIFEDTGAPPAPTNAVLKDKFIEALNEAIGKAFGSDYENMVKPKGDEIHIHKEGSSLALFEITSGAHFINAIGFEGGATTGSFNNKSISDLFDLDDFFDGGSSRAITIGSGTNVASISISATDTLDSLMKKINESTAGVTLSYSAKDDALVLESKTEGSASNVFFGNDATKDFFAALKIGDWVEEEVEGKPGEYITTYVGTNRTEAQNLIAVINGMDYVRQSNTFTEEGVTFTFNRTFNVDSTTGEVLKADAAGYVDPIEITITKNTEEIVSSIKAFVEEYNSIVDMLNGFLSEKRSKEDRDYRPLSDDEKKEMTEDEIKRYEERAKYGMLANDTDLRKLLDNMRSTIYQKVEGVGLTMYDIGISTSPNWKEGGRLTIDEEKLNTALENKYDEVVALFTKTSGISATDTDRKSQRMSEMGIARRLNEIFNDAVRTTTVNGKKGYLVEKAGVLNDGSAVSNILQTQLTKYDERIATLTERWYRQEKNYIAMFARMETAMSKMIAQQNSLASLMAQQG